MEYAWITLAAVFWVASHLGISGTGVRGRIVARLGENGYLGAYSLLAAVSLGLLILAYAATPHHEFLWTPGPGAWVLALLLMPLAFVLIVGGVTIPNPTAVGQAGALTSDAPARGVLAITRHPVQWGIGIWAGVHLLANPDVASLILFGSLAVVSVTGMLVMDRKAAHARGAEWQRFAEQTSLVPGVALLAGRARLDLRALRVPLIAGLAVYAAALFAHRWLSGGVPLW